MHFSLYRKLLSWEFPIRQLRRHSPGAVAKSFLQMKEEKRDPVEALQLSLPPLPRSRRNCPPVFVETSSDVGHSRTLNETNQCTVQGF